MIHKPKQTEGKISVQVVFGHIKRVDPSFLIRLPDPFLFSVMEESVHQYQREPAVHDLHLKSLLIGTLDCHIHLDHITLKKRL
jgi:hypothetical protein